MAWDSDTLAYVRSTLGNVGDVFTDGDLAAFYTQVETDRGRGSASATIYYAVRAVALNAALLSDYTAGQTQENRSQVARQLRQMMSDWEKIADDEDAKAEALAERQKPQVVVTKIGYARPQKETP